MKKDLIDVLVIDKPQDMEYQLTISNEREKTKIVKRMERIIRGSIEYKDYIAFLRENVGMDACAFFNNINKDTSKSLRIEIHHVPFTLFDITKIIVNKYMEEGLPLNELLMAEEVMKVHYSNMVGLIPLSKTLHLMVHGENAEKVVIPAYMIFGNYKKFIEGRGFFPEYWCSKDEEIIVLSMYDGIGTGRYCLDKMGFTNVKYYAYEIDKYAMTIAKDNYPDIIECGDAFQVRNEDWKLTE